MVIVIMKPCQLRSALITQLGGADKKIIDSNTHSGASQELYNVTCSSTTTEWMYTRTRETTDEQSMRFQHV
jgi:hypothetical protein